MSSAFVLCRVLFVIFSGLCKHEFCKMRCVFAPLFYCVAHEQYEISLQHPLI